MHISLLFSAALTVCPGVTAAADREGERLADAAVALCQRAERLPADERPAMLRRGLTLAERALARDESLARAHFALFCTLGKLVDLEGIGWRSLGAVQRVREAIDRAVALGPNDVDALVGKGALLLRLPRLLGGDRAEAARCLDRAVQLDPWHARAREYRAQLAGERPAAASTTALSAAAEPQ